MSFDSNLDAYHHLNRRNEAYVEMMLQRMAGASLEKSKELLRESFEHFGQMRGEYKILGEEMVRIMTKHWWEFWK